MWPSHSRDVTQEGLVTFFSRWKVREKIQRVFHHDGIKYHADFFSPSSEFYSPPFFFSSSLWFGFGEIFLRRKTVFKKRGKYCLRHHGNSNSNSWPFFISFLIILFFLLLCWRNKWLVETLNKISNAFIKEPSSIENSK